MKTTFIILFLMVVAVILLLFVLGMVSRVGESPGLVDDRLSRCPDRPNCRCSEYPDDTAHFIQPVPIPAGTQAGAIPLLKAIVDEMGGTVLVERDGYLATTFRSAIFGFMDDMEFRIDAGQQRLHIRSGSRVGYSDGGVNGKRIEQLKKMLESKLSPG